MSFKEITDAAEIKRFGKEVFEIVEQKFKPAPWEAEWIKFEEDHMDRSTSKELAPHNRKVLCHAEEGGEIRPSEKTPANIG